MKTRFNTILVVLLAALGATIFPNVALAGTHVWSGAVNGYWNVAGNWSSGGLPVAGEADLRLTFPAGAARTLTTNNIGALTVLLLNFGGSSYVVRGAGTLSLPPAGFGLNLLGGGGSNRIESPLQLTSMNSISIGDDSTLILAGAISGTGSLSKYGLGTLGIEGGASNPFSGGFTIVSGKARLKKTGGATALMGPISIGTTNGTDIATVHIDADDQISDGAHISFAPSGVLVLGSPLLPPVSDTVGSLSMVSGYIHTWDGVLGVGGNWGLDSFPAPFPQPDYSSVISGNIAFHGPSCTITVTNGTAEFDVNILHGGSATVLNKAGAGTLHLKGDGTFTGPLNINAGKVIAERSTTLGTTAGITTVAAGASLQFYGEDISTSEPLSLAGNGVGGTGALQLWAGATTCFGNVTLNGNCTVNVMATNALLNLWGVLSGSGALRKIGPGELMLSGAQANTFTGGTLVSTGKLTLKKTENVRAVSALTITNQGQVWLGRSHQIETSAPVTVYNGGLLNLGGFNQSLSALSLVGGLVDSGAGTLTLLGDLNATAGGTLRGNVSLGGAMRRFKYMPELMLDCEISDGPGVGGLVLDGQFLHLQRSNSFSGPVYLNSTANITASGALGRAGGNVFVTNASQIYLCSNAVIVGRSLVVANDNCVLNARDNNAWTGPIELINTNSILVLAGLENTSLILGGAISGPGGLFFNGYNSRVFMTGTNANTYTGLTDLSYGDVYLILKKTNAIAVAGDVWIGSGFNVGGGISVLTPNQIADTAKLRFLTNGWSEHLPVLELHADDTVRSVEGAAYIVAQGHKLMVGTGNASSTLGGFSNFSYLDPQVEKIGRGDLEITHGMYDLTVSAVEGSVRFNGGDTNALVSVLYDSRVIVHPGATLAGVGGPAFIDARGGRVEPGRDLGDGHFGVLRAWTVLLNSNSTYRCEIAGTNAGVDHDRLSARFSLLTNAILELRVTAAITNPVVIIENHGGAVQGTFAGLPEGQIFSVSGGHRFSITYQGGDGNDVVLIPLGSPLPGQIDTIQKLSNGTIQIGAHGSPGVDYVVEANANLSTTNWVTVGSVTADGSGALEFMDSDAMNFPMRFYRFVIP